MFESLRLEVLDRGVVKLAEGRAELLDRPHVELALDALGVGVQRRAEASLGTAHLAQHPIERLAAHLPEPLVP